MLESLIQESDRAAIIQSLASEPDAWSEVLRELTRLRPESKECRRNWIDYELARGNWKIAAEGLADYTGMTPQENYQRLYQLATLQAALQDVPAHREVCTQLFEKYAPLFPESAPFCEQISKSGLLLPGSPKEIERACQLALRADEVAGTSSTNFWIVVNRALAHYRRGEFDRAVEQADRSLNMPGIGSSPMQAQAFAVKAMSQQRQGDSEAARKLLVLAQSRLSTNAPAPLWGRPYDHNWSDWLRGEIVVQEAEKLINP